MNQADPLLLAFYADDFTGSTDALESLTRAGVATVLFMDPPGPEELARHPGVRAIGVAGRTRSLGPDALETELRPALAALRELGAAHVHYKVCSTFDSSPFRGSIGRAIDVGAQVFGAGWVPVVVGAPGLGRYCLFGNLFARMGIGSAGEIFRLDRHPSMSRHPVTPADESDLRLHLARQTRRPIGLVDVLALSGDEDDSRAALGSLLASFAASSLGALQGGPAVFFDVLNEAHLERIGRLIDGFASSPRPLFSVGSSGIEGALGYLWCSQGAVVPRGTWPQAAADGPILVASGSASPVTDRQISHAVAHGFAEVALDTQRLILAEDEGERAFLDALEPAVRLASDALSAGVSVIVHTTRGALDPRIAATTGALRRRIHGSPKGAPHTVGAPLTDAQSLGLALGLCVRTILSRARATRVVVAGGDTSSYAARALGIRSLEMVAPTSPGAPLCRVEAPGSPVDGLLMAFKGGQVGGDEFFVNVATQSRPGTAR